MTTVQGLHCGTYQTVEYEVFGFDRGQWLRVGRYETEYEAKTAFNNPALRAAYPAGLAWCERVLVETRILKHANVPVYQLVMQMRGEDGEPGPLVKNDYDLLTDAAEAALQADAMPDCISARIVDLSTGRTVEWPPKKEG